MLKASLCMTNGQMIIDKFGREMTIAIPFPLDNVRAIFKFICENSVYQSNPLIKQKRGQPSTEG
jgi:hypothetical protein